MSPFDFPSSRIVHPTRPRVSITMGVLCTLVLHGGLFTTVHQYVIRRCSLMFSDQNLHGGTFGTIQDRSRHVMIGCSGKCIRLRGLILGGRVKVESPRW